MPFAAHEICFGLACGRERGWHALHVHASALRRLGLHPDQPAATPHGPSPPAWWHAAAERRARLAPDAA